uniref:Type IV secretion protein Rhs n=1 Tax=Panagrolaimus sp. JU765 TaxID=591449 RepID=A0AC34R4N6_9BILA
MRPAEKYQDETANQCRNIPTECLTVANGGIPLGPVNPQSSKMVVPAIRINGNGPPPVKILTGTPDVIT